MSYNEVLDSYGIVIEEDLKSQLDRMVHDGQEYHPFLGDVYEATREFVLRGGKRLAACSTLVVHKGYSGQLDERIIRVCSGFELYRHSILVHDDIVDAEDLRRGIDTLHKTLGKRFDERFGVGSAMFAGNILYALAIKSILESAFPDKALTDAARLLASEFKAVNESQILDMLFEYNEPTIAEWEVMASRRAASLFRASMLTGALFASAPQNDMKLLDAAAMHIGYAFDIQDDIIDTFASEDQYGRVPCGDISKRKKPLHIILALGRDRRLATIMEEGGSIKEKEIENIQAIVRDCGALEIAKSISREHAKKAEKMISLTEMDQEAKEFFISFIKYVEESLDWYK